MGVGSPDDIIPGRLNPRNSLPDPPAIKVGMAFDEEAPWGNKNGTPSNLPGAWGKLVGKPSNKHDWRGMFDGKASIKHGLRGENDGELYFKGAEPFGKREPLSV